MCVGVCVREWSLMKFCLLQQQCLITVGDNAWIMNPTFVMLILWCIPLGLAQANESAVAHPADSTTTATVANATAEQRYCFFTEIGFQS